jgi:hypothetical protein
METGNNDYLESGTRENTRREMVMVKRKARFILFAAIALAVLGCSPKIHGTVQLLDQDMQPLEGESPEGTVVNMMNTSVSIEEASHSATVDAEGRFESEEDALEPGLYKVETGRLGYITDTREVELGGSTKAELEIKLQKIPEGKRRSIGSSSSDEDKIINPGEVNIQPPMM